MDHYTVDFSGVKTYGELHERLKKGLELPAFYGGNVDALWDCLTGFMDDPAVIILKGVDTLPPDLQEEGRKMLEVFSDAVKWYAELGGEFRVIADGEELQWKGTDMWWISEE